MHLFRSRVAAIALLISGCVGLLHGQSGVALVRHAPAINGTLDGSLQQMLAEDVTLNGGGAVTGSLYMLGTPRLKLNGKPAFGGTLTGTGAVTPANHTVTLNGNAQLGHLVTRVDALTIPTVTPPAAPTGTRTVTLNKGGTATLDFTGLRDLTLNGNAGQVVVPAGTYGDFNANGGSGFTLGVAGGTQPLVYNFQHLTLNGGSQLQVVGPVIVTIASSLSLSGAVGAGAHPEWLQLRVAGGDLTVNGNVALFGYVTAPRGTVTINGNSQLIGGLASDQLTLNGNSLLRLIDLVPTVALTGPAKNTVITAPIASLTLTATATDADGVVAKVAFFAGSTKIGETVAPPYQIAWTNIPAGTYSLTAVATDNAGVSTTSAPVTLIANAPPTVALSAPAANAIFTAPGAITLTANAADSDGTVAKVEFFNGSTKVGEALAAPFQVDWTGVPYGTYTLTAVATDNLGAATTSAPVSIVVNQPPVVSVTTPKTGDLLIGPATLTLAASASDVDGSIAQVSFFNGTAKLGDATASAAQPSLFTLPVTLAPGVCTITAVATDNLGASATTPIVGVTVDAPPTAALTAPVNGAVVTAPASIILAANASDADGTIAKVDFLQGSTVIGTVTAAPYTYAVSNLAAGAYTFGARATDNVGAVSPLSTASIIVNAPPTVGITAPADHAVFAVGKPITLTADASDSDGTVARVEFFQGSVKLGEATAAPFTISWASAPVGHYAITARATDDRGAATISAAVNVTVDTPPTATAQTLTVTAGKPFDLVLAGTDAESDPLTFAVVAAPAHGTLTGTAPNLTYTAAKDYAGADTFTFKANDGMLDSAEATVAITVNPANHPPVANAQTVSAQYGVPITITLTGSDLDSDPLVYTVVTGPAHGTLTGTAPTLTYTATAGYVGADSIVFKVNDGHVDSPTATVAIDVAKPPNRAPAFVSTPPTVMEVRGALGGAGMLHGTIRDFSKQHPNFEHYTGTSVYISYDVVQQWLGADQKPVPYILGPGSSTDTPENFNQWYNDTPGVNFTRAIDLPLTETTPGSGVYQFRSLEFFPIDGEFYGSEGLGHNFNFTDEYHSHFIYRPGATLTVGGDDAIWVFVDNRRVIDLGGVHVYAESTKSLDGQGLVPNQEYSIDIFHAEQHTGGSSLSITANFGVETRQAYTYGASATDPDGDPLTYSLTQGPAGMTIDATTGVVTWLVGRDNMGTYPVVIEATDPLGLKATQTYSLNAFVNLPPEVTLVNRFVYGRVGQPVTLAAKVTDDGFPTPAVLTQSWSLVSGPDTPVLDTPALAKTTATFPKPGIYVLQITANDGSRQTTAPVEVHVDGATSLTLPSSVVGRWPGNDTPEDIVGGHHAKLYDGAGYGDGAIGRAFKFSGGTDFARVVATPDLNVGTSTRGFAVEFWFRNEDETKLGNILQWRSRTNARGFSVGIGNWSGTHTVDVNFTRPTGDVHLGGDFTWALNRWVHVAFSYDRQTGLARLYCDGRLANQTLIGDATTETSYDLWWGSLDGFKGSVDDLIVYNAPITAEQAYAAAKGGSAGYPVPIGNLAPVVDAGPNLAIRDTTQPLTLRGKVSDDGKPQGIPLTLQWSKRSGPGDVTFVDSSAASTGVTFTQPGIYVLALSANDGAALASDSVEVRVGARCAPPPDGLVAWWPGNDTSDDVVGGATGTWINGASYGPGMVGDGFVFDGAHRLEMPRIAGLDPLTIAGLSVSFWVRPSGMQPSESTMLQWRDANGRTGVNFRINYSTAFGWTADADLKDTSDVSHIVTFGNVPVPDVWQLFTMTYDCATGVTRLYRNAALVSQTVLPSFKPQVGLPLVVGNVFDGNFRGGLDELALYRRALRSDEVTTLYAASSSGLLPASQNQPPVVSAGPDQYVRAANVAAVLAGSVADDGLPAGSAVQTRWSLVSGPVTPTFVDAADPKSAVTFPAAGTYVLKLVADDGVSAGSAAATFNVGPFNPPAADLSGALAAWWPGNDSSMDVVNQVNALWCNVPAYVPGKVSDAFSFDGQSAVQVPASTAVNSATWPGWTLEFWLKPSSTMTAGSAGVLQWRTAAGATGVAVAANYSTAWGWSLTGDLKDASNNSHTFSVSVASDVWQHYVITYDRSSGRSQIFRNGVTVSDTNIGGGLTLQTSYDLWWGNFTDKLFRGAIDEITLYKRALTGNEAAQLFAADATGKSRPDQNTAPTVNAGADLVAPATGSAVTLNGIVQDDNRPFGPPAIAWTPLIVPVGGNVTFSDPNSAVTQATFTQPGQYLLQLSASDGYCAPVSDTMIVRVAPAYVEAAAGITAWWPANGDPHEVINGNHDLELSDVSYAPGESLQGLYFNGATSYARVAGHSDLDIGAAANPGMTIEFWARWDQTADRPLFAWMGSGETVRAWTQNQGTRVSVWMRGTDGQDRLLSGPTSLVVGQLVHLAITYDRASGIGRLYYNGRIADEQFFGSFTPDTNPARPLWIGSRADNQLFKGIIDEFSLYKRALAPTELQTVFGAGNMGKALPDDNTPPTVDAGPDQVAASTASQVTLAGQVTDDNKPFGPPQVQWSLADGPAAPTFTDPASPTTTVTFVQPGTYVLKLTAWDKYDAPVSDFVTVRVGVLTSPTVAGIAAWWPANGDPREVINGNHDLELENGATYVPGVVSQAIGFDGVASFARVAGHADLDIGASPLGMTIEFWARWDGTADNALFDWMGNGLTGTNEFVRAYTQNSGRHVTVWLRDTQNNEWALSGPDTLAPGQWVHLAVTYDRATRLARLFYNGKIVVEQAIGNVTLNTAPTNTLWLGSRANVRTFKGAIDEVTLYKRALSVTELGNIIASASAGKTDSRFNQAPVTNGGPNVVLPDTATAGALAGSVTDDGKPNASTTAHWSLVDGPGTAAVVNPDAAATSVGFDKPGTYLLSLTGSDGLASTSSLVEARVGVAAVEPPTGIVAWWSGNGHARDLIGNNPLEIGNGASFGKGVVSEAITFDGTASFARVASTSDIDIGASPDGMTIEFWARWDQVSDQPLFAWMGDGPTGRNEFVRAWTQNQGRHVSVWLRDVSNNEVAVAGPDTLVVGQWTHIAVTYDKSTLLMRLFYNGALVAEQKVGSLVPNTRPGTELWIGSRVDNRLFKGAIDEFTLYRRALSIAEIAGIAQATDGKCPPDDNAPPFVDAGLNVAVPNQQSAAHLSGIVQDDNKPFGAPVVKWSRVAGPAPAGQEPSFTDATSAATDVTFPAAGTYLLKLTASDRLDAPVSSFTEARVGVTPTVVPGVSAWWSFNGHVHELVNGGHDLEIANGAVIGDGRVLQGLVLDGKSSFARVPAHSDYDIGASPQGMTIEFWARWDQTADQALFAWLGDGPTGRNEYVRAWTQASGRSVAVWLRDANNNEVGLAGPANLTVGQWTHIAATYDRSTYLFTLYYNGVQVAQASIGAFVPNTKPGTELWLGSEGGNRVVKGAIDEFSLYKRALTPAEIAAINSAGVDGKSPVNTAPHVTAGLDVNAYVGYPVQLSGTAIDDGLPNPPATLTYQWSVVAGTGNVTLSAPTAAATTATFDTAGNYTLRLTASDSLRSGSDDVQVSVTQPASVPPTITIYQPANGANLAIGTPFEIDAHATDADGTIAKVEFFQGTTKLGEQTKPATNDATTYFWPFAAGLPAGNYTFSAVATDNTGMVTASAPVTIGVIADPGVPVAKMSKPDDLARVSAPTAVTGLVQTALIAKWQLQYRLKAAEGASDESWITFASGTQQVGSPASGSTPATPGALGTFDPTSLINGIYEIQLKVTDTSGRTVVDGPIQVVVEGNMKVGVFSLAFEDLKVPVAGIPITVTRTYDSRDVRVGDFGPGWRLAVANVRVQKNRNLGVGWYQTLQSGNGLQFYYVTPVGDRIVTVVMPDGETHRFKAGAYVKDPTRGDPDNASFPYPATHGKYRFYPIGDTTSKLEPLDATNTLAEDFWIAGTGDQDLRAADPAVNPLAGTYNATRFRLTTKDGTVYVLDEALGLLSLTDLNGNTLVVNRDAQNRVTTVVSTPNNAAAPVTSVTIHRDATGRVDYIRDPAGKDLDYLYDTEGRLSSFTNRTFDVTQFFYENKSFPYYLTRIVDPRGVNAIRTEYDATGKMVKQTDAAGNTTVFTHTMDPAARSEKVKDRLGNETTFYYDDRGNVTTKVDALGAQTTYSYYPDSDRAKYETDHYGNVKSTAYDATGNPTVQTIGASASEDPATPTTGYISRTSYNALSAPKQITDPDGRVQTFGYDPTTNALVSQTVGTGGSAPATTTFGYNTDGTLKTQTDAAGNVTSYTYENGFSDAAYPGAVKRVTTTVTDPAGTAGSDPANASETVLRVTRTLFDGQENQVAQIVTRHQPDGTAQDVVTKYLYDLENRLVATVLSDGRVNETRYNAIGKEDKSVLWKTLADYHAKDDTKARITSYGYDSRGNQTSVTYADGTNEASLFDAEGRRVWSQDRRGYRTFYQYDKVGRLRFTIYPDVNDGVGAAAPNDPTDARLSDNPRSETRYDLIGRVTDTFDEVGQHTKTVYYDDGTPDATRRKQLIQVHAGGDLTTTYEYDKAGNVRYITDPRSNKTETQYDDQGRPTFVIHPATDEHPVTKTETRYDALGRRIAVVDQEGKITRYRYDGLGQLIEVRQYMDQSVAVGDADFHLGTSNASVVATLYTYDELGNESTQTDALGRTTTFWTDALGRRTKRILPKDSTESVFLTESQQYDDWGNLWKRTDFAGKTTNFGYDALNRLTSKTADPTHASLTYSHAIAKVVYEYDENGARKAARTYNASNTLLYSETTPRDERGRVDNKNTGSVRIGYGYYANGLLKDVVSSNGDGVNIGYRYDDLNRLAHVDDASSGTTRTSDYTYNANGSLETLTQPNGIVHSYGYDALNRLRTLNVKVGVAVPGGAAVGTVIHDYEYKLYPSGHRHQVLESVDAALAATATPRTTTYQYDTLFRLTTETIGNDTHGNNGGVGYDLDKVGNRLGRTVTDALATRYSLPATTNTYNARDWLAGDAYDANGNTVSGLLNPSILAPGSFTDSYDFENRLIVRTKADGSTINVSYDADGNRIAKTLLDASAAPMSSTTWLVDTNNLTGYAQVVEERYSSGGTKSSSAVRVYTYGSQLISRVETLNQQPSTLNVRYYLADGHGNVRELTDAIGSVADRYEYDAFGNLIFKSGSTANAYLYCGEQFDADLDLYYLRARYMNLNSGRFWSMDSYEGMNQNPAGLQKYLYGNGEPINGYDPSGHVTLFGLQMTTETMGVLAALTIATVYIGVDIASHINIPITFSLDSFYDGAKKVAFVQTIRKTDDDPNASPPQKPPYVPRIYNDDIPVLIFVESEFPYIAPHIKRAQASHPSWAMLTRAYGADDPETEDRRAAAIHHKGRPPRTWSWDEYPFASSFEGGVGASVELVPLQENRKQGGVISAFYRTQDVPPLKSYLVQGISK